MKRESEYPTYPPLFIVKITEKLRRFFLRLNRRFTHPNVVIWETIHNFWVAAAINVAAELGIADILKEQSRSIDELAEQTQTHAESLYRMMRMLASQGIFREVKERRFITTSLARPLEDDQIRYLILSHLTSRHFFMFADLMTAVKTGKRVSDKFAGDDLFKHLGRDEQRNEWFNKAMSNVSKMQVPAILSVFSFKPFGRIIDVGGGHGLFLAAILQKNARCKGVVFDLPQAILKTRTLIDAYSLGDRLEMVGGDFFESVPGGGDLYMMKSVLHDWDDESSIKILNNVREAMSPSSRLLIIEAVIEEGNTPSFGKMTDILMMVALGGKERTRAQFESLLSQTGFKIRKIHSTITPHSIIEAEKI